MNPTDLLIIYLAFGAPIAVYKYLQNRSMTRSRRVGSSVLTFFFWVPAAVRIGYLYFTNANLADAFVSHPVEESEHQVISAARDALGTELIRAADGLRVHDVRDTIERYTGLASAAAEGAGNAGSHPLLEAVGRNDDPTGTVCLNRKNRNRLERHYKWARQDFLMLFEYLPERSEADAVYNIGLELTRHLKDEVAYHKLKARMVEREAKWTEQHDERSTAIFTKHSTPVAATMTSINGD